MQTGEIIRHGAGCAGTRNGRHLYEFEDGQLWCRQCGHYIDEPAEVEKIVRATRRNRMSLDISLNEMRMTEVYEANYTHNVTPMWREAGVYDALYASDGAKAGDVVDALREGVRRMTSEPEKYRAMNPENGWGDYDTALRFLMSLRDACELHMDAVISVCK